MDSITLTQNLVTFLAPFLPYLLKAGEKAAEEVGKELGAEAWERVKALWSKLRGKPEVESAAQDVAAMPDDPDAQAALRLQLKKLLAVDKALAAELGRLLQEAKATEIKIIASGEHTVTAGRDMEAQIGPRHQTGFQGPVQGPIHTGSGNINYFVVDPETLKETHDGLQVYTAAAQQETKSEDKQQDGTEPRFTDASGWRIESPSVAVGSIIEFFPGTVYEASIRQLHAGGYETVLQYSHPGDSTPNIILLKDGTRVEPIIDPEERVVRFPKRTVWITDKVVIPLGPEGGRPDKETWMVELPSRPVAQRAMQQYGLERVCISQEFIFENDYRVVATLNPSNPSDKRIEVYFYHQGKQIQPIIDYDTRTVGFPPE